MSILEPQPERPSSMFTFVASIVIASIVILAAVIILGRFSSVGVVLVIVTVGCWALWPSPAPTMPARRTVMTGILSLQDLSQPSARIIPSAEDGMRQLDRLHREGLIEEGDYYWKRDESFATFSEFFANTTPN